jgi:sugar phosphate isomerase/epimerase
MEGWLQEAANRGLGVELQGMFEPKWLGASYAKHLARVEKAFEGFPGKVSIHAPFYDLNPISPDPALVSITRRRYEQAFEAAEAAGADLILFHSQCAAFIRDAGYMDRWLKDSRTFWKGWEDTIARSGWTVVFENVFESDWGPLRRLLDALQSPRFRACLDLGHAHLFSGDAPAWVTGLGETIAYIHLHDNDGVWDHHWPPGQGGVDIRGVLERLEGLAKKPRIHLEIYSLEGIEKGLAWMAKEGFLSGDSGPVPGD